MPRGNLKINKMNFQWTIESFSTCKAVTGKSLTSPIFTSTGEDRLRLKLLIFPNGCSTSCDEYVSLKMSMASQKTLQSTYDIELSIMNTEGDTCHSKHFRVSEPFDAKGASKFIKRSKLFSQKGLLSDDTLVIGCQIRDADIRFYDTDPLQDAQLKVAHDLQELMDQQSLCDVTFTVNEQTFQAHKAILAARSSVFAAMFRTPTLEYQTNAVHVIDIEPDIFAQLLAFVYTGKCKKLSTSAADLLIAADKYDLEDLKLMCQRELSNQLSVENAARTLILSDIYSAQKLKKSTMTYINKHSHLVLKTAGWKTVMEHHLKLIAELYTLLVQH